MTGLRWSRRTTSRISEELCPLGIAVCPNTVARLLHQMGYSLRVNHKQISTDFSPDRNLQFEYLAELRGRFQRRHLPVISVDTKKRELVGNFRNAGRRWECRPRRVFDHDFRTDSIGVAIPYGIYDITENRGAFIVGVSHDTAAFAAHAIAHWWQQEGSRRYTGSRQLLILADTGGSNSYRCYLEDRASVPTGQLFRLGGYRRPLSDRSFQMEPHRTSSLLGGVAKLGW